MLGSILGGLGLCCACGSPNPAQGCLEVFAKPRSSMRLRKLRNHVVYRYELICEFLLYLGPSWNISTNLGFNDGEEGSVFGFSALAHSFPDESLPNPY